MRLADEPLFLPLGYKKSLRSAKTLNWTGMEVPPPLVELDDLQQNDETGSILATNKEILGGGFCYA